LGNLINRIADIKAQISGLERAQRANTRTSTTFQPGEAGFGNRAANTLSIANLDVQIQGLGDIFNSTVAEFGQILDSSGMSESDIAMTLRFAQDVISDGDVAGSDNDNTGGHLKFGALITNIENQADLMSIELGIRGDPYWLGKPNSFYDTALRNGNNLADFEKGSNGFYLKCALPYPYEDANGRRKPNVEYEISGFYTDHPIYRRSVHYASKCRP
jgi:hypothetical protein